MKCWYCDKDKMKPAEGLRKGWLICSNCGATYCKLSKPGRFAYEGVSWDKFLKGGKAEAKKRGYI